MTATRHVVFYESADDVFTRAAPHQDAHRAHLEDYAARGLLIGVGVFEDPQADGAMCVLTSHEAAEEFARTDPFVVHGVVRAYRVKVWRDLLA